ncbi:hypothetical protein [Nonomuraea sp. NPDC005650]|uniref:hypothetical protein n=1 Tax=Nonomuraea sp. NPDC005650 TaxID=3157045 RepID=UPI0033A5E33A
MAPTRKTRTAAADQAAAKTETPGEGAAPLEPQPPAGSAPLEPPAGDDGGVSGPAPAQAAPVAPPVPPAAPLADPDAPAGDEGGLSGPAPAQAAPLEPPAAPVAPIVPPGPPVDMKMIATPGAEFVDLVWDDGKPAGPDELFVDPGSQYTYVMTARAIHRHYYLPGARRLSGQLVFPEGWKVAREHADRMTADLRRLREEQAAAEG